MSGKTGPLDLLAEAESLGEGALSPARRRTVVSRAYYAAYHFLCLAPHANSYVRDRKSGIGGHRQFIRFLTSHPDHTVRYAGRKLDGLYGRRIRADYYLGQDLTNEMVREALEDANEIVREILAEEDWIERIVTGSF